jgi:hypothetical protein
MTYMLLLLVLLPMLASGGPMLSAVIHMYTDQSCSVLSPAKPGLPNPSLFASTCTFYQSGPPLAANSVSATFQSCTSSVMKLNTWSSGSAANCVGISDVVAYDVGICKAYTDSGATLYYKVTCSPASALSASLLAALLGLFLFVAF